MRLLKKFYIQPLKIIFIFFLTTLFFNSFSQDDIFELKSNLESCKSDTCKLKVYLEISNYFLYTKPDSSKFYAIECFILSKKINNEDYELKAIRTLAIIYRNNANYQSSITLLINSLQSFKNSEYKIRILMDIAENYCLIEDLEISLNYYYEALELSKETKDTVFIYKIFNRLASVFYQLHKFDIVYKYTDSSIQFAEKFNDMSTIANNYEIIGASYNNLFFYSKKLDYYNDAKFYLNKAIEINIKQKDSVGLQNNYFNLALSFFNNNENSLAASYFLESYELCNKFNLRLNKHHTLKYLSQAYYKLGKYREAFKYLYSSFILINDIYEENNQKALQDANKKYETEKKQIEIENQKKLLAHRNREIKNKNLLIKLFVIISFIFIIFTIIVYFLGRKLKKSNKILISKSEEIIEQKTEIENQNEVLLSKNNELQKMSDFRHIMVQMLVHDLKNPLNRIINYGNLMEQDSNSMLMQSSKQMLNLVENILNFAKIEQSEFEIKPTVSQIGEVVIEAFKNTDYLFHNAGISFLFETENDYSVSIDKSIIARVFENLFINAIKFTKSGGYVKTIVEKQDNSIKISIVDNGSGIPPEKMNKLFKIYEQIEAKKIGSIFSSGVGLYFCYNAIKAHNSELKVKSVLNEGTEFWFYLPIIEKVELIDKNHNFNVENEIVLNSQDIEYLKNFADKLKEIEIYDITQIKNILNEINEITENIKNWKELILNDVKSMNSHHYQLLLLKVL